MELADSPGWLSALFVLSTLSGQDQVMGQMTAVRVQQLPQCAKESLSLRAQVLRR
jgi:hypothetical protein